MACPLASSGSEMPTDHPSVDKDAAQPVEESPIPQPPPTFLLGNFPDMDPENPSRGLQRLADLYGEIYQLQLGRRIIIVSSQHLINELCDQDRFHKDVNRVLDQVRALTGDGLFTAAHEDGYIHDKEPNWWKAHRLLVPAFGPLGLRKMFDDMQDIASQMVLRWDRLGADHAIDCSDDFTRLAFDTIGLCSFGYRFNDFYSDNVHPFATQMADVLKLSGRRSNRTDIQNTFHRWEEQERVDKVGKMHGLVQEIIKERKRRPQPDAKDLLNTMLFATDRETGETLGDENVANNMVTFLVAGHETTSATLSFMFYNLLKHPDKYHKAQAEVDSVVGDNVVTLDHLSKLPYIDACIKETLRLNSPISAFGVIPKKDTTIGNGKYKLYRGDAITFNVKGLHHDPAAWGEDHNDFSPERFLDGKFANLPPNSWKPFGNGLRACIGRGFAEQEMLLNTAMILQRFSPEMADPSYELDIKSTLTIKPVGFFMKVKRRPGKSLLTGIPGGAASKVSQTERQDDSKKSEQAKIASGQKAKIFYGGNSGTCEGFAQSVEGMLSDRGVEAEIASLDSATDSLSKDSTNIIISASYEGQPPDNARKFVSWLENLKDSNALKGVKYSVFGVGNSDWQSTFHRIPKLIDQRLQELGAEPIQPAGLTNVKTDLIGPFDDWTESLLNNLSGAPASPGGDKPSLNVSVERASTAKELGDEKMGIGTVMKNEQLADASLGFEKKHIEVRLPEGMAYQAGDYLVIQPRNADENVQKVMRYFDFDEQTRVKVEGSRKKFLPSTPTPVDVFLKDHVELGTPVTKRQLRTIAGYAKDANKDKFNDDAICEDLISKRYTIIDVLIENRIDIPFALYIDMLLPLTPRQYSISSSPLQSGYAETATITYDVQAAPAFSGHGMFQGACSSFLKSRKAGDRISCFVRPTNLNFRLPGDTTTPIMMFAAGTGIAPMRAFLQERAAIASAGGSRKLGPALLFYGSRDSKKDFLYKSELEEWQKLGIVTVYGAHSRMPDSGKPGHPKYVQDAIWEEREQCGELFKNGGKIYLCGSAAKLGQSCADVCKKIWMEFSGKDETAAEEWLQSVKTDRYIADVY